MTKRLSLWAAAIAGLLAVPLIAMQFNTGVNWTPFDFLFMAALLFGSALAYELVSQQGSTMSYRTAAGIAALAVLLLLWVNAAVGLIGDGPVNMLYLLVPVVLLLGAFLVRFRPLGMMYALCATAIVQLLIPVIALLLWHPPFDPGIPQVFALNAGFALLFSISALLFRHAATHARPS